MKSRSQKSGDGSQNKKPEVRIQVERPGSEAEGAERKAGVRIQETEARTKNQKSEARRQKSE
jgi:hypothetical protein